MQTKQIQPFGVCIMEADVNNGTFVKEIDINYSVDVADSDVATEDTTENNPSTGDTTDENINNGE